MSESYNPWTVVSLVFHHLVDEGLHPVLGADDPGGPAAAMLEAFGIEPVTEGNQQVSFAIRQQLADLRSIMLGEEA